MRRQGQDKLFQSTKLIAGMEHAIIADASAQFFEIGHIVERDNRFAPCLIDQHITGNLVHEGDTITYLAPVIDGIGPCEGFGDNIVQVDMRRQYAPQTTSQQPPARQNDVRKPPDFLRWIAHPVPPRKSIRSLASE